MSSWIWLVIAALALAVYLIPTIMRRVYIQADGFRSEADIHTSPIDEHVPLYKMGAAPETLGSHSFTSEPAPIEMTGVGDETPLLQQGRMAQKTVVAPAVPGFFHVSESFQTTSGSQGDVTPPTGPAPSPVGAPPSGPKTYSSYNDRYDQQYGVMAEESSCGYQYVPNGDPIYTCSIKEDSNKGYKTNFIPEMPEWLMGVAIKDAYTESDLEAMKLWLNTKNIKADPGDFLIAARTLKTTGSTAKSIGSINTSTAAGSGSETSSTKCETPKPKCETPKPKCKSKTSKTSKDSEKDKCPPCPKCPPPKDYIRKEDIPCWACKV